MERHALAVRVLARTGFLDMLEPTAPAHDGAVSTQTGHELTWHNDRLQALRSAYQAAACDATEHTQWTAPYVLSEVDPFSFRGDSAFLWQHRDANVPVSYLATYYYLRDTNDRDLLEACQEDMAFGADGVQIGGEWVTRDRLDSTIQLGYIRQILGAQQARRMTLLDIGSGYGRLAWRVHQCFPDACTLCVDAVPESTYLCEFYLRYRDVPPATKVIELPQVDAELGTQRIDMAVAFNSLSECSSKAVSWWFDAIARWNVPRVLIAPHWDGTEKSVLRSKERSLGESVLMEPLLAKLGYHCVSVTPKYPDAILQRSGVSPTYFHLFEKRT